MKGTGGQGGSPSGRRTGQVELRAAPTPRGIALGLVSFAVAGRLLAMGLRNYEAFPPSGGMDGTLVFAGLPVLVSVVLILVTVLPFLSNMGVVITVRRDGLRYTGRNMFFDAAWGRLTYLPPTRRLKGFRSMVLGTRETRVRIDELFLPDFERLASMLDRVMTRIEKGTKEDGEI